MRAIGLAIALGLSTGCSLDGALVGVTGLPGASGKPPTSEASEGKWASVELTWTAEAPATARVGEVVKLKATAQLGSSSCTRFVAATAKVDEGTRTVRLSGTKAVAPSGQSCSRDINTVSPPLSFTPKNAGTWRLEGPGLAGLSFEVLPAGAS
jgi:hypothetical protein